MSGFKLILLLLVIAALLMAGLAFSGDPGSCGAVESEMIEVLPVLNKVNRLIAGEVNQIELTDDELTAAVRQRLDPKVKNFRICFEKDRVKVSGQTTNRIGLSLKFNVAAQVMWEKNYPQINNLSLRVGRIAPPSGYIQGLINQRLAAFNFGRRFAVDINPGVVILQNE